ncbi:MAG: DUF2497 domain-containing protein [Bradyrhizobium sp.]|nr:DUF2497 domain-containing protein [Bradyrhizobium sp.]
MTQPAKVQEPSMEEILASIRRIIADDEAKPPAADKTPAAAVPAKTEKPEKPAAPAAAVKAPAANEVQPPATRAPPAAAPRPAPPPAKHAPAAVAPPAPAAPPPPVSNSQDDIDALLNGLDEATSPEEIRPPPVPEPEVFELTDEMAVAEPEPASPRIEPQDDLDFAETVAPKPQRQPAFEPPPLFNSSPAQQILSRSTVSAVESAFNTLAHTVLSNNARTLEDLVKEMLRPMLKSWLDDNLPGLVERIVKAEIERVARGGR